MGKVILILYLMDMLFHYVEDDLFIDVVLLLRSEFIDFSLTE